MLIRYAHAATYAAAADAASMIAAAIFRYSPFRAAFFFIIF